MGTLRLLESPEVQFFSHQHEPHWGFNIRIFRDLWFLWNNGWLHKKRKVKAGCDWDQTQVGADKRSLTLPYAHCASYVNNGATSCFPEKLWLHICPLVECMVGLNERSVRVGSDLVVRLTTPAERLLWKYVLGSHGKRGLRWNLNICETESILSFWMPCLWNVKVKSGSD